MEDSYLFTLANEADNVKQNFPILMHLSFPAIISFSRIYQECAVYKQKPKKIALHSAILWIRTILILF